MCIQYIVSTHACAVTSPDAVLHSHSGDLIVEPFHCRELQPAECGQSSLHVRLRVYVVWAYVFRYSIAIEFQHSRQVCISLGEF